MGRKRWQRLRATQAKAYKPDSSVTKAEKETLIEKATATVKKATRKKKTTSKED